ncbi:RNA binding (RRM/RBD/RNP motifs) family protein [Actinidia rufa]|uniref:RNA binding (RRM/RBD/RNP motifs) family protein n=1 Tax=Actinidia rufa TaxID=165716 RepID=A0A7J0GVJ7_9ERIC|nr:RNA binding (RRM/RBD/RNP motifs) family protein [Actinidia rufa]
MYLTHITVCVWCWHHIMDIAEKDETEGRCPACRTPYDKEKIVAMEANCQRVVSTKKEQKSKPQKPKPKKSEGSKDLTSVRVIQRRMAYVIGLPLRLADENVRNFSTFVSSLLFILGLPVLDFLLQRKEYFGQYGKVTKVSLSRTAGGAIQQFVNDTCSVASFGTAKYCHAWLRNMPCINSACLYLHSIGADEDSFSKDEEAAVHTRNRVHQIVGATHNMQRCSGNMLPPPIDDPFNSSRVGSDKTAQRDITHSTVNSNGHLTCSHSSKDKDGRIKTPNRTFVDIVGGSSSGPEKDGSVAEERKILSLCSDFSSGTMDEGNHLETQYSNSMLYRNFRSSKSFSNEEIVEQLRRLDDDNITNDGDSSALNVVESSIISNILSMDFDSCDDSLTSHGLADLFDGTGGRHGSWNYRKSDESRFSFAKKENSENQETVSDSSLSIIGQVSKKYSSLPDSMENKEHYFGGPRHHVSRAQSLTPPGFSVPSREPPPGFSARERTNQGFNASSGSNLVETSSLANNQYYARSAGNMNNTHDFDFMDPAVLAVGRGKSTNMLNNSSFEARSTSTLQPTNYEDEAKLWHLMQQSGSYHQDPKYPPMFSQENQSANWECGFPGHTGNGFSAMNDTYGYSLMLMDQQQTAYNSKPFPATQLSQQKYGNGHISNGYHPGLNEAENPRNERIAFNKYYPGYGDLMLQMPGTGDVYNRVYGL